MPDIIAIVFDFDDTLAPDSTSGFLESHGIDVTQFWKKDVQALVHNDWDPVPAYLYKMIDYSNTVPTGPFTRQSLAKWGSHTPLFTGVEGIFERLRAQARALNPNLEVEFYLISSGIGEILRNTPIAKEFTDIWSCDFLYGPQDDIVFPKKIVSFTDKTRYLFHISKGLVGTPSRGSPFDVNLKVQKEDKRIPFHQMVFVGDGYTDIPCFSLIKKNRGIAVGVYDQHDREGWGRAWGFLEQQRISNLVPAEYTEKSALSCSLMMAIESIANKIELASNTYQG